MAVSYAENAVMTKARAMYGRRLRHEDYNQLLQKKSVGEVAAYLKKETAYSEVLSGIQEDLIHRGQLENLIRRRVWDTFGKFLKYSRADSLFLHLYTARNEIDQLLSLLRHLQATNTMEKYKTSFPGYLARYFSFDLYSAAQITTFDQLMAVLEHTPYYKLLYKLGPPGNDSIDILACERALRTYYYRWALENVNRRYRGEARDSLVHMLYQQINFYNFSLIYRLKKYFGSTPDDIRRYLVSCKTNLKKRTEQELEEAADIPAFLRLLEKLPHLRVGQLEYDPIGELNHTMGQRLNQRAFRFSTQPPVVLISYMALLEIETVNIINIIEGIRYGVSPEEINLLLDYQRLSERR